jgi:hypothetical protein
MVKVLTSGVMEEYSKDSMLMTVNKAKECICGLMEEHIMDSGTKASNTVLVSTSYQNRLVDLKLKKVHGRTVRDKNGLKT